MPGKPDKQHRIRVRTLDGKPRDQSAINRLKSNQLGMPHLDIVGTGVGQRVHHLRVEGHAHRAGARRSSSGAGLEAIDGGDTTIAATAAPRPAQQQPRQGGFQQQRGGQHQRGGGQHAPQQRTTGSTGKQRAAAPRQALRLRRAPNGPDDRRAHLARRHEQPGRLSGEIRFELEALTPLLVGWERGQVGDTESDWPVPANLAGIGQLDDKKSVLCPLRAPWGKRPVVIPGDSLKGLLRHELGALLGAPMERVAERSYSYRPNAMFRTSREPQLIPRLARVPNDGVETKALDGKTSGSRADAVGAAPANLRVQQESRAERELLPLRSTATARPIEAAKAQVRGSTRSPSCTGSSLPSPPRADRDVDMRKPCKMAISRRFVTSSISTTATSPSGIPMCPSTVTGDAARARILKAAKDEVFQPGDLVWVEWDTEKKCIVSLGWHYYYRWAYTDSVRKDADAPRLERHGLFPLDKEREKDGDGARRSFRRFGGSSGTPATTRAARASATNDHAQLMGRVFVNAGLEVVGENDTDEQRFLGPTFLKELGMPRPSAVEHYLKQPHHPRSRPSDNATLVTYGDAAGYDAPGELAGRKFYLDRPKRRRRGRLRHEQAERPQHARTRGVEAWAQVSLHRALPRPRRRRAVGNPRRAQPRPVQDCARWHAHRRLLLEARLRAPARLGQRAHRGQAAPAARRSW